MHVVTQQFRFQGRAFDPRKDDGPLMLNKLHLNNVHCTKGGMYLTGLKTGGMLLFNGREIQMAVELPPGTHNARPFRDGVLFNDTEANVLRYAGRGDGARGPRDARADLSGRVAAEPRARTRAASRARASRAGSPCCPTRWSPAAPRRRPSPSTTCRATSALLSVNLTMDVRNAIHGLEVWPY